MARFIPHQATYDTLNWWSDKAEKMLITTTILTIILAIVGKFNVFPELVMNILNSLNSIIIIGYAVIEIYQSRTFHKVEYKRRLDFVGNSFRSHFIGLPSTEYYTNEELNPGIYKLGTNCFESSLFTYNIGKRMIPKLTKWVVGLWLIFFISAFSGPEAVFIFIQLSLPIVMLQQLIKLISLVNDTDKIFENFKTLFNSLRDYNGPLSNSTTAEIIKNVLSYEANIAWASVQLDSKIYTQINPQLSQEWDNLKRLYNIRETQVNI